MEQGWSMGLYMYIVHSTSYEVCTMLPVVTYLVQVCTYVPMYLCTYVLVLMYYVQVRGNMYLVRGTWYYVLCTTTQKSTSTSLHGPRYLYYVRVHSISTRGRKRSKTLPWLCPGLCLWASRILVLCTCTTVHPPHTLWKRRGGGGWDTSC